MREIERHATELRNAEGERKLFAAMRRGRRGVTPEARRLNGRAAVNARERVGISLGAHAGRDDGC
jgi:hypothetical protein